MDVVVVADEHRPLLAHALIEQAQEEALTSGPLGRFGGAQGFELAGHGFGRGLGDPLELFEGFAAQALLLALELGDELVEGGLPIFVVRELGDFAGELFEAVHGGLHDGLHLGVGLEGLVQGDGVGRCGRSSCSRAPPCTALAAPQLAERSARTAAGI